MDSSINARNKILNTNTLEPTRRKSGRGEKISVSMQECEVSNQLHHSLKGQQQLSEASRWHHNTRPSNKGSSSKLKQD
jgi:hypothetical protein